MSSTRVRYSVGGASVGLDFGDLRWVQEHTGMDRVSYMDVRFQHGVLQMTSEQLAIFVRQAQQALATRPRNGHLIDCSGAVADIEEGE